MAFCSKCGKALEDNVSFCDVCGQKVETQTTQQQTVSYEQHGNLLQQLSGKIKTEAIIWVIVASLQVLIGFFNIMIGIALNADYEDGTTNIITGVFVLFVAVINYVSSSQDFKYSRKILEQPTGILAKYSPIGNYIGNLIYNLIFGGVVGVVGSIYGFFVRNFVVSNEAYFKSIESQFLNKN